MENSGQNMLFQIDLIVWEKARELLTYQYTLRSLNYLEKVKHFKNWKEFSTIETLKK